MLPGLFVVGTDTGVGKTRVASAIARGLVREGWRVGVVKPVATGVDPGDGHGRGEDGRRLLAAVAGAHATAIPAERVVPLVFEEPLAPVVAARRLGLRLTAAEVEDALDSALAWWRDRAEVLVVEGIGGLLTPVAEETTVADLAIRFDYPLVVVARRGLGTLNHTLLTIEAARGRGLRIAGLVLSSPTPAGDAGASIAEETGADELARRLPGIAVLAEVPFRFDADAPEAFLAVEDVGWSGRALVPRGGTILDRDVRGEEPRRP
jgi:dethiobiotin synthetase